MGVTLDTDVAVELGAVVEVAVAVRVLVEGTEVCVLVRDGMTVLVGRTVLVRVGVELGTGVLVLVETAVFVRVAVGRGVLVLVGIAVPTTVGVGVTLPPGRLSLPM